MNLADLSEGERAMLLNTLDRGLSNTPKTNRAQPAALVTRIKESLRTAPLPETVKP